MNLTHSKHRSKFYYDRHANTVLLRQGEQVYLVKAVRQSPLGPKFDHTYTGPCEIIEINFQRKIGKIQKGTRTQVVHLDKLKQAHLGAVH